jgi:multidrug resistance efflux pump
VTKFIKYLLTAVFVLGALFAVFYKYRDYIENPWTRDGQVRAEVIQITPRVSGPIVKLMVKDNQLVNAGDLLFEIDPRTFTASLAQAQAQYDETIDSYHAKEKQVESAEAQIEVAKASVLQAQSQMKELDSSIEKNKAEYSRQKELIKKRATSQKSVDRAKANYEVALEKRQGAIAGVAQAQASLHQAVAALAEAKANLGAAGDANASIRVAQAALHQAGLNLLFTKLKAPVDGYVTNLNVMLGSQAVTNQPLLALVDINSYWVHGFFKETLIGKISKGNNAIITLMTYPDKPLNGIVDSIGWGIAQQDGSTGFDLLPTVSPTFEWIRLAQRVPVRIHLTDVPQGVALRVGTTASVLVMTDSSSPGKKSIPALPQGAQ